jgi:hypothetical protein
MAAVITICVHNLVDDLYDHSLTNLMALLLIALISLGRVTSNGDGADSQETLALTDHTLSAYASKQVEVMAQTKLKR